jgi:hypothetical protein
MWVGRHGCISRRLPFYEGKARDDPRGNLGAFRAFEGPTSVRERVGLGYHPCVTSEHPTIVARRTATQLLEGTTAEEFRAVGVEALRRWRRDSPASGEFAVHADFALWLIPLLSDKKGIPAKAHEVKEPFLYGQSESWAQPLIDFFAWMVTSGLAIPLYRLDATLNGYAAAYRLTSTGVRLLSAEEESSFSSWLRRTRRRTLPGSSERGGGSPG